VYFYQVGLRLGIKNILEDGVSMGFADKTGIDLPSELRPLYPRTVEYFNKLYGPRGWTPIGPAMNFSIGQGENTQTLISMMRFYQALAGSGAEVTPYIVKPSNDSVRSLGLTAEQLAGLRQALISVVEHGTGAGAARATAKGGVLAMAGKTGTAQNPHGKDHGWFIGFAPADKPTIVVGGIMEFALHGTVVAPYAMRVMRRYVLGPDAPPIDSTKLQVNTDDVPTPRPDELAPDSAPPADSAPPPTTRQTRAPVRRAPATPARTAT
jgi:penicillin-binding protein 2